VESYIAKGGMRTDIAQQVHGQVGIASAKLAYEIYQAVFASDRFRRLVGCRKRVFQA